MSVVQLAFVPGVLGVASSWSHVLPPGCNLIPVDYKPSAADRAQGNRTGGLPGDFVDVAALRLLSVCFWLAASGQPWAIGGHSAGGAVVYRCLDYLAELAGDGYNSAYKAVQEQARKWLPAEEVDELASRLQALSGQRIPLPLAVFSFEGSLVAADVEGWADDWAARTEPLDEDWCQEVLEDPAADWTWPMASSCAASLWARCEATPPRHLASISRWLQVPGSPGLVYVAGENSADRNAKVFPALTEAAAAAGAGMLLQIVELKGAGHGMETDAPAAVRCAVATALRPTLQLPESCVATSSRSPSRLWLSLSLIASAAVLGLLLSQLWRKTWAQARGAPVVAGRSLGEAYISMSSIPRATD